MVFGVYYIWNNMAVTLNVETRRERGKELKKLREAGKLPAIMYGPKEESQTLFVDAQAFDKLFREAGESTIITLKGLKEDTEVLVQDIAFDPARGGMTHVDFYAIERGKELTTNVPLEYVGEAPAVKLGGTLTKVLHEVEVTCRPAVLPREIMVDVSALKDFEHAIHVKDLPLPEDVRIENDPDDVVTLVQAVEEEAEEETEAEAVDMDTIAVEEKGKKEEEANESESEKKEADT